MYLLKLVAIFFITLISYYNYDLKIAPFVLMGSVMLATIVIHGVICGRTGKNIPMIFFLPVFLFLLIAFPVGHLATISEDFPVIYSRYAMPAFIIIIYIFTWNEFKQNYYDLRRAVEVILWVHLAFFYTQFFTFLVSGDLIDFIEPITGETQRVFGGSYSVGFLDQFVRTSGLFAEPGTYANVIFPLFLLHRSLSDRYSPKAKPTHIRNLILDFLVLASIVLSFSFFGYVFIIVYGFIRTFFGGRIVIGLVSIVLISTLLYFALGEYVTDRLALGDESGTGFRIFGILEFVKHLSLVSCLFGWGFLSDTTTRYPDIVFTDIGLIANLILFTGAVGFILSLNMILFGARKMRANEVCLVLVMLLSKLTITYLIFWILLGYLNTIRFTNPTLREANPRNLLFKQSKALV